MVHKKAKQRQSGRTPRMLVIMGMLALASHVCLADAAPPNAPLRINNVAPKRAIFATRPDAISISPKASTMERALAGVLLEIKGKAVVSLLKAARPAENIPRETDATPAFYLILSSDDQEKQFEVLALDMNRYLARPIGENSDGGAVVLDAGLIEAILAPSPAYRGNFEIELFDDLNRSQFILPQPYTSSTIRMDRPTFQKRLFGRSGRTHPVANRDLGEETIRVRLPRDYDPHRPSGLLVWCSPSKSGKTPAALMDALDELNFVCVGVDNAGNKREFENRAQLLFDVLVNASQRYHIDPRRVYLSGLSGGGRMSSILAVCFPEVFRGAIPIVGFSSYSQLSTSRRSFVKPRGKILRQARQLPIALMSGPPDFNYKEMKERQLRLEKDGFEGIRFFEYPDMAHMMPQPEHFLEALRYVDEAYQKVREEEIAAAEKQFAVYRDRRGDEKPESEADRRSLREVMRTGPWTEAAWNAARLLRLSDY